MSDRARDFLAGAAASPVELTVRELLAIWGYRARTYESVARVQRDLDAAGLRCEPGIGDGGLGSLVRVGPPAAEPTATSEEPGAADATAEEDQPLQLPPVALLVRHVPSATGRVISVHPDQTLADAQSLMSFHDYSQLPVLLSARDLKGVVSWQSIAQAHLAKPSIALSDATVKHPPEVHADDELLRHIGTICRAGFVFVRDEETRVCGIVTTADLSGQFRDLTTPFFQLGEIEGRLRRCIDDAFTSAELHAATGRNTAAGMTFGNYVHLLRDETQWQRMNWGGVSQTMFVERLDAARLIRNRVMHFGEELTADDKQKLVQCLNFIRALDPHH
jgi:restriction system protein